MKKNLLRAFFLFVIILGIILFFIARRADRIVEPYVRSLLEQNKPMNHRIEYDQIRLNLVNRSIIVKDVRIFPDSSVVKDEHLWMEVSVNKIRLTNFKILKLLLHKKLSIGDFILLKPVAAVYLPSKTIHKDETEVVKDTIVKPKAPLLGSISLERVTLDGGSFSLFHKGVKLASSDDINFVAEQISLVKNKLDEPVGYSYGDVKVNLSDISLQFATGLYNMSLKHFALNKQDSSVVLKEFRMIPKYKKGEFEENLEFQNDRFDVRVGTLNIEGVGYRRLLNGQPLEISKIHIDELNADIYRDKNVRVDSNHFPQFYNESFLKINSPIRLDTLLVSNSIVKYGELAEGKEKAGEILLEDFKLHIFDLSNILTDSTPDPEMQVFINAMVMGEGSLNVELVLPLTGRLHDFKCSGSVGSMKLSPLNDMLEPSINMKFIKGDLNRMTFAFSANDNISSGWMEFLYQDLDIELLKKDPEKQWGFISLMANAVAVSNNPAPGKELKIVTVGYERNKYKGLINYVWKTIQSGMINTILPTKKHQINWKQAEKEKSNGTTTPEKNNKKKKDRSKKKKRKKK